MKNNYNEKPESLSPMAMRCIEHTKKWIEQFVIKLDLCPFARHPFKNNTIRYVVMEENQLQLLAQCLIKELYFLQKPENQAIETTLIIHPQVLTNFYDYNDFLHLADQILKDFNFEGIFQIASFHPDYQFEATQKNDVENFTNRSPFPMLHLLRETSIDWAVAHYPNIDSIPQKNIALMQQLGLDKIKDLLQDITKDL